MNITLKRTEEQVELVKAMASKNKNVAYEAQAAAAEFIGPVLSEVMNNAPTLSNMFQSFQFNDDDNPSIPLDLYHDITDADYLEVYSQSGPGGLPSNTVIPTHSELKFTTYRMETAVDFERRYAARSRLDVISKTFSRIAQELMLKQEQTSANLLLGVLANATTNSQAHVIASATANQFLIDDVNRLITRAKRINTAWNGGTPVSGSRGVTDLIVSPEIMGEIRAMAYNPLNTKGSGAAGGKANGDVINITEINEMGVGQRFNAVYDALIGATAGKGGDVGHTGTNWGGNSGATADEIIIGIDRTKDSLMRAVSVDSDTGSELKLIADDQYTVRQQKIGYYGSIEEGRMVLDKRALTGIVV